MSIKKDIFNYFRYNGKSVSSKIIFSALLLLFFIAISYSFE
ncbi:hypothetical protein SSUD12_0925 [Streptococcus suis D12]|uniref:Uncharacterized protein n=1 Tax=Streptococcus suis D12 TaxID=1004952 RepID=G7SE03_STRSU|nr:hypothetical protein SSUD12_0925 [Streptococcus suis D12]